MQLELGKEKGGTHSVSLKYSRDFTELNFFVLHIIPRKLVSFNGGASHSTSLSAWKYTHSLCLPSNHELLSSKLVVIDSAFNPYKATLN